MIIDFSQDMPCNLGQGYGSDYAFRCSLLTHDYRYLHRITLLESLQQPAFSAR